MNLTIPELSLVVLIGAFGSGKSTSARKNFKPTEVLSSDDCRGLVSDDVPFVYRGRMADRVDFEEDVC
jgi:protein phosphatase